ncbi:Fucosyl transferase [Aphelenchoides besseyi]|nr:Fucosyl transferase [Aphelenchoides besseyi]
MNGGLRNVFLLITLILIIITTIFYFQGENLIQIDKIFQRYSKLIANQTNELNLQRPPSSSELPLILFWTDKFSSNPQFNAAKYAFSLQCEWKCRYTYDKSKWNESRSVLIREQFPSGEYPAKASAQQRVIIVLPEAPGRLAVQKGLAKIPKNYINMTYGFMRSMDIYKPYDLMVKQNTTEQQWNEIQERLRFKTKGAFIVHSHCKTDSQREKYIAELRKHFPVDTFGKCGESRCDQECMKEKLRDYRFYIAFENNVCEDYITEKFYRIKNLILPLVLNDSIYRDLAPENSYIAVDTFKNISGLAEYLQFLMEDDEAYLQHFAWTRDYSLRRPALFSRSYCDICRNAHDTNFHRVYEDIAEWFSPKRRCDNTLKTSKFLQLPTVLLLHHESYVSTRQLHFCLCCAQRNQFHSSFFPSIGLTSSSLLPMLIGIDRVISVYFPMRMVCCLVSSVILIDNTNATYFLTNSTIMNSISFLCYVIMWIRISYSRNVSETTKKSFTSFAAIMGTLLIGHGFVSAAKLLLISFNTGPVGLFQLTLFNNTCVNIVAASNAYVIIMFRQEGS